MRRNLGYRSVTDPPSTETSGADPAAVLMVALSKPRSMCRRPAAASARGTLVSV